MSHKSILLLGLALSGCVTQANRHYAETFTLTTHGTSMLPAITSGDHLSVERLPYETLKAGQIVAYESPYSWPSLRVHRLERLTSVGWLVKGDNNAQPDMLPVTPKNYVGVVTKESP